ncbi:hypothetical protein G7B40_034385 [Aetokthonos hydrillicola Thurmond2011]|jgi:hypothetical protein|uniref:Uncharacterized protein n=1 Tax=Aetokthonos hydrillicola Thurmond2011 TaxID=2712845 RepID=A0AAP5IE74_9CYAN|nr:hypothetical protein [Aetokthonos hydrillicola]MBW4587141.1 hypothetical protein [Aetokthonos hydrillicola CCALA 1050]MDR9899609.1 hypothetical protein [Aetokthonos hydrillicola Thurmond2011]
MTVVLADMGKLGSQLNFVFGLPPKVTNNDISSRVDRDTYGEEVTLESNSLVSAYLIIWS